jgi:LPXTG-motif cell wall-anchored protein
VTATMITRARGGLAAGLLATGLLLANVGTGIAPAGAQTSTACTISASPTSLPAGGGDVTVNGDTKPNASLTVYINGEAASQLRADDDGHFKVVVHITRTSTISVSSDDDDYPIACDTIRIVVEAAPAGGQLARTGSSNTVSIVLIALALAAVGATLVVATRRRRSVTGRI